MGLGVLGVGLDLAPTFGEGAAAATGAGGGRGMLTGGRGASLRCEGDVGFGGAGAALTGDGGRGGFGNGAGEAAVAVGTIAAGVTGLDNGGCVMGSRELDAPSGVGNAGHIGEFVGKPRGVDGTEGVDGRVIPAAAAAAAAACLSRSFLAAVAAARSACRLSRSASRSRSFSRSISSVMAKERFSWLLNVPGARPFSVSFVSSSALSVLSCSMLSSSSFRSSSYPSRSRCSSVMLILGAF